MRVEFLRKTRLADNKRCAQLILYTTGHNVEEIKELKANGRKIVSFSADNNSWFFITALREAGIGPDIITDNGIKTLNLYLENMPIVQPTELLMKNNEYYFIITNSNEKSTNEIRKQLLLWGVRDFAILTLDFIFDFDRAKNEGFKNAFIRAYNAIYEETDFSEDNFNAARYNFINPVKWWYNAVEWVIDHYSGKENLSLLDVGPGVGLASLILKDLLSVKLNWINLEQPKKHHQLSQRKSLIENESINVQYGYIEADDFPGTYDIILFTDVIEHLAYNPVNTMKKLFNMLNPHGHIVVTTPHTYAGLRYYAQWRDMPMINKEEIQSNVNILKITGADHVYEYTPEELQDILDISGFEVVFKKIDSKITYICTRP